MEYMNSEEKCIDGDPIKYNPGGGRTFLRPLTN
uniref:Uncharacterized protein n=1 Tax=Lepeophtheirus salmonis TaxID=72036 RepID=A0A0K2TSX6_LEPSM